MTRVATPPTHLIWLLLRTHARQVSLPITVVTRDIRIRLTSPLVWGGQCIQGRWGMCPSKAAALGIQLETMVKVRAHSHGYTVPLLDPEVSNFSHEVNPLDGRDLGLQPRYLAPYSSMFNSNHSLLDELTVSHYSPSVMPPDSYLE